jgi:hypothetical protein
VLTLAHVRHDGGALRSLGPDLDALLQRCAAPMTSRRPWLQAWLDCERDVPLRVTTSTTPSGALAAALLLVEEVDDEGRLRLRTASPRANDRAMTVAADRAAARRLAGCLRDELQREQGRWVLELGPVPVGDLVLEELARVLPHAVLSRGDDIPLVHPADSTHECTDPSDCTNLSVNMRRNLRKARNRLLLDGRRHEVRLLRSAEEVQASLDAVWRVRCARDAFVGRPHLDPDGREERFWRHSLLVLAELGMLELAMLEIDGELAAYVLALDDDAAYRVLEGRFDSSLARYNPGKLLEAEAVRRTTCLGRRAVDWMNGVAPHKLVAATGVETTQWLHAAGTSDDLAAVVARGR